jgi:hypothetical protein
MGEFDNVFQTAEQKADYLRDGVNHKYWETPFVESVASMIGLNAIPADIMETAKRNDHKNYPVEV